METKNEAAKEKKSAGCGFACMECGHKFKTIAAAQKAAFGERGCPKCGGADIDLSGSSVSCVKRCNCTAACWC